MERQRNVLRVNAVEEQSAYRDAVAEILRLVQNDHKATLLEIAESTGISLGTISNAANKKTDLSVTFLKRLGQVYGPHTLDPYAALVGARMIPRETGDSGDVLPVLTLTSHLIAQARSPSSPGGVVEVLRERLGYLSELRRTRREIDSLIAQIEKEAA